MKILLKMSTVLILASCLQGCDKEYTLDAIGNDSDIITLSQGNLAVREALGNDTGEMQFDTNKANTFRKYVTKSSFSLKENYRWSSQGGTDFSEFEKHFQFCSDGSFTYNVSSFSTVKSSVGDTIVTEAALSYRGNWEVAELPNSGQVVIMHSTDPDMLKDYPDGIMQFKIASYAVDFVSLPSGNRYSRTANETCD